jgi:hypothetical protein
MSWMTELTVTFQKAFIHAFWSLETWMAHALGPIHDFIEPLCKATVEYDLSGECSGAKLLIIGVLHIIGFILVYGVWGPVKKVAKAEDQILRFAADEGLPTASPAASSSSIRTADRSTLRQRH